MIAAAVLVLTLVESRAAGPVLKRLWLLDGLASPESVIYDEACDCLYVSSINGGPADRDGNGFISKVSLDGRMLERQWVSGLHAPKGLALLGGRLYVADIDTLVEIDVNAAAVSGRFPVDGAVFLNDVTSAGDGMIYVSDTATDTIHRLQEGTVSVWLQSAALRGPNGLLAEAGRMLVAAWGAEDDAGGLPGQVLSVSRQDRSIRVIGNTLTQGNLDGIETYAGGGYLITRWMTGQLLWLQASGEAELLLTLEKGMADLDYLPGKDMLVLPMLKSGKLIAYSTGQGKQEPP